MRSLMPFRAASLSMLFALAAAAAQQKPADPAALAREALKAVEKTAEAKAEAARTAAEEAAAKAEAARKAAGDAAALKAAEKAAQEQVAAAKAAAAKAEAARKAAGDAAAQVVHSKAALAYTVARVAGEAVASAEGALGKKGQAAKTADADAAKDKAAATKAREAADAAQAAFDKASTGAGGAPAALEKDLAAKRDACKAAEEKALASAAAARKAETERAEAEKDLAAKRIAHRGAVEEAAVAKAASLGGLTPLPEASWTPEMARHLLWRAGFGGTPEEVARLHALGLHAAVRELVFYSAVPAPETAFEAWPREAPLPRLPYESRFTEDERLKIEQARQQVEHRQVAAFRAWWLRRMAESPRPLQEKLTLFWHGHFACQYSVLDQQSYLMYRQNQMFRQHAAGTFGALLRGLVHDATMIRYLNNDSNVKGKPNENLAREILELFSMGTGNYTEEDIREASRALTGYTFDGSTGEFRFVKGSHDETPKTLWGRSGNFSGDDLVDVILQQPATARFIARKLFAYFAHDDPSDAVVDRLAASLRSSQYHIGVMLENLFTSAEFYDARARGTQIKNPVQLVVGTLRALGVRNANYGHLDGAIRNMGQSLLEPPNVKGWEGGRTWIDANRIFHRYNAVADLLETVERPGAVRGIDVVGEVLPGTCPSGAEDLVDRLARACLLVPLDPAKRQALVDLAAKVPPASEWGARKDEANRRLRAVLVLLTSSPEYQLD